MPHDEENEPSTTQKVAGKVEEALGWATADRKVEARGKLRQLDDDGDADTSEREEEAVLEEADLHVRSDHGDLAPEAEPASDDQPVKANPKEGG